MSAVDRARWNAWWGVASVMRLGPVTFRPIRGGWSASAKGHRAEGNTGVDALVSLCFTAARLR